VKQKDPNTVLKGKAASSYIRDPKVEKGKKDTNKLKR
jgi:hypothetical protein